MSTSNCKTGEKMSKKHLSSKNVNKNYEYYIAVTEIMYSSSNDIATQKGNLHH